MDRRVMADKLERLRRCVQRIEQKRPATLAALTGDVDLQDILSVNLAWIFHKKAQTSCKSLIEWKV